MRFTMKNFMLGAALAVGILGIGTVAANAAPGEFRGRPEPRLDHGYGRGYERPVVREVVRPGYGYGYGGGYGVAYDAPVVEGYIPPCPGDGYVWIGGAWVFRGRPEVIRGYGYRRDFRYERGGRGFERGRR
jgi:hypothetical protein